MANFQLEPGFDDVIRLTDEADTIEIPAGDRSRDRVFNFDPATDRIDLRELPGVTAQELLDNSISRPNGLLLVGSFGRIGLFGVAADQLSEDNFIVGGGNQPPIASDDLAITMAGTAVEIAVLENDFDFEGDILSIIDFEATTIASGTISIDDNGTPDDPFDDFLRYVPGDDFLDTDSFIYTISDGEATATATVTVERVFPTEPPPVARSDFAETTAGIPVDIDVLANDFTIGGGPEVAIASFAETTANGGTVILNDNGTPDDAFDDSLEYTPAEGFTGTDSFSYTISNALNVAEASVTVQVNPIDGTGPVAVDDTAIAQEDRPETIAVLENDFNAEGRAFGLIFFERTTENGGTVTRDNNNTARLTDDLLVYTPADGFTGTDSFTYSIGDANGNFSTATVDVTVSSAPEPGPVATDDRADLLTGESETIAVLENDFNPDGDPFGLIFFERTTENGGTVTRDNNNTPRLTDDELIYTAADGFIGEDSFAYSISDALGNIKTAVVNVTVSEPGENEPPVANDDFTTLFDFDAPVEISVLDNDFDPDNDALTIAGFSETTASGGTVTFSDNDTPEDSFDDFLTYTPAFGFTGTDSFSYTVSDDRGGTDAATVNLIVQVIDDTFAIAIDDFATTIENLPVNIFVLDNDSDSDGDIPAIAGFSETTALGGTVSLDNNGTPFNLLDDSLIYTPAFGFAGTDSFSYSISDDRGGTDAATVTVQVIGSSPPLLALDDFAITDENIPVDIFVLDNDFDEDGDIIFIAGFSETTALGGTVTISDNDTPDVSFDDFLTYTPAFGFTGTDSFSYTITDGRGGASSATVAVTVSSAGDNEPPIAFDDFAFTGESFPVDIFILDNDFDSDGDPISIAGFPETTANGGDVSIQGNSLVYTPAFGFTGTDSFSYSISDDRGGTDAATVTVQVIGGGPPPIALDDIATTIENLPVNIFVLDNDSDPDGDILAIAGFPETTANGGDVSIEGNSLVYTPAFGFFGTDSFIYSISDDRGGTDTATVTVTVEAIIDDFPFPVDDVAATVVGTSVEIFVLDNDFGPDENISLTDFPETTAGGTVVRDNNGSPFDLSDDFLIYTPDEGFTGTDSFSYTVSDNVGLTDTATVQVTVNPELGLPLEAEDDSAITVPDVPVEIFVLDNDSGPDGVVELIDFEETSANSGMVAVDDNDTASDLSDDFLIYTPAEGFTGTDTFTYIISDSLLSSADTATVTVTVNPLLGLPLVAEDDFAFTTDNVPVAIFVLDNDLSPDGVVELIDFEDVTASGGIVSLDNNGTPFDLTDDFLTYLPAFGFSGIDSFSYSIGDGSGQTETGFVTVEVDAAGNAPPIAFDDFAETFPGVPVNIFPRDNDFDPSGNPLATIDFEGTTENGGIVTRDENGSLLYTPAADFIGTDSFTYRVSNGGITDTATVSIIVDRIPEDLPPLILGQEVYTSGNEPVDIFVLENQFDPRDIDREIVDFEETPEGGTLTLNDNGTSEDPTDDFLTYTPTAGFTGTDAFSYSISDDRGLASTASATVTVLPEGQSVVAMDDFTDIFLLEGNQVNIFVLDNDISLNGDAIALIEFDETAENGGTVTRNDFDTPGDLTDDVLIYTPEDEFFSTDSFSYSISDGSSTDTAVVDVVNFFTIAPPFLPRAFAADDRAFIIENSPANIPVLDNDFSFDQSAELTDFDETTAAGGTIARNENGTPQDLTDDFLVYTPDADFVGADSFTYSIIDDFSFTSSTAVVNVVVVPADSTVSATDDEAEVIKNNPTTIFVLANDFEVDGNLLEIISFDETTANGGTVSLESFFIDEIDGVGDISATDDIIIDPLPPIGVQGYLLYSPADDFTGTDSFTYSISNPDGVTDTATVRVTVAPSPPFAGFPFSETFENVPVTIDVLSSAFDIDRDSISLTDFETTSTLGGTVSLDDNGTPDDRTDDRLIYDPPEFGDDDEDDDFDDDEDDDFDDDEDDFDSDTSEDLTDDLNDSDFSENNFNEEFIFDDFNYTITDSSGLTDVGEVSIDILPAPAGFAAVDDFVQTFASLPVKVGVLDNDFEINDEPLELISFGEGETFEWETENGGIVTRFENNTPEDLTDDYLVYTGEFDEEFFVFDSFSYTIANADGSTDTGVASVSIEPTLTAFANFDDAYTFTDIPINIDVLANDFTVDNSEVELIDFETTTLFAEGTIARDDKETDDLTDDSLIYTPGEGFTGSDGFSYSISDVAGNTTTGFVSVIVDPLPEAGFAAVDDFVNTSENEPVTIPVLDNDFDVEGNSLVLASFEETTFNGGAIARDDKGTDDLSDDELRYTPPAEGTNDFFIFLDSFSYTVSDPDSNSTDTAIVDVEITPEPPSASDDTGETLINTAVNIPVLENDFGVGFDPGDPFSSLIISGFETTTANGGQVILDNNASSPFDPAISDSLIYIPAPGFTGTDSFSYSISDGFFGPSDASAISTALVTVTVLPETETLGI